MERSPKKLLDQVREAVRVKHYVYSTECAGHTAYAGARPNCVALLCRAVIDAAQERRKLYQKKTIVFVKDVLETLNLA